MLLKACWLDWLHTSMPSLPVQHCLVLFHLVLFSLVLGALSNGKGVELLHMLLYLPLSYGWLRLKWEVRLAPQKVCELLCFWPLCLLLLQQQNWSDQAEKDTAANMEMLVFSPSLSLCRCLLWLERRPAAQGPSFVIKGRIVFHGSTAVVEVQ